MAAKHIPTDFDFDISENYYIKTLLSKHLSAIEGIRWIPTELTNQINSICTLAPGKALLKSAEQDLVLCIFLYTNSHYQEQINDIQHAFYTNTPMVVSAYALPRDFKYLALKAIEPIQ